MFYVLGLSWTAENPLDVPSCDRLHKFLVFRCPVLSQALVGLVQSCFAKLFEICEVSEFSSFWRLRWHVSGVRHYFIILHTHPQKHQTCHAYPCLKFLVGYPKTPQNSGLSGLAAAASPGGALRAGGGGHDTRPAEQVKVP